MRLPAKKKSLCCGCSACLHACPHDAIEMATDEEGFSYPKINDAACINCGLCLKVCPARATFAHTDLPYGKCRLYAAFATNAAVRKTSASGGIAALLARKIVLDGGVAVGCVWDGEQMKACHRAIQDERDLASLSGSKYIQSDLGQAFVETRQFLLAGRTVIFFGTPCQVSALRLFLRKSHPSLICVELICHGVASPAVLTRHLEECESQNRAGYRHVFFRDKTFGWKRFSLRLSNGNDAGRDYVRALDEDAFLRGFLADLYLRPSCSRCRKGYKLRSDFVLGDYWTIGNDDCEFADEMLGVSAVVTSSRRAEELLHALAGEIVSKRHELSKLFVKQFNLLFPPIAHGRRKEFFKAFTKGRIRFAALVESLCKSHSPRFKLISKIANHFKKKQLKRLARRLSAAK